MQKKTANAIITKKMNEWFDSIKSARVRQLAVDNTIVTGGSIASMLLGESVNDYDVYFKTKEACYQIAKYYADQFNSHKEKTFPIDRVMETDSGRIKIIVKSAGIAKIGKPENYEYFETITSQDDQAREVEEYVGNVVDIADSIEEGEESQDFIPIFVSSNAITLNKKVQLVFRFYGTPEEIHETYDFVHCTSYWTSWDKKIVTSQEALESLLSKQLSYMNSQYPVCAMIRTRKFLNRGWSINAGQYLKIAFAISELDLTDPVVLEDQLVGVDQAYFMQVIEAIKKKREADPDFVLNFGYLATIIDKIF